MPTKHMSMSEKEIKIACLYWLQSDCPTPVGPLRVLLNVDRPVNPSQLDPGNGITASVEIVDPG